jgi:dTDP-4-dehydrorhamnose 3,5-epimerase
MGSEWSVEGAKDPQLVRPDWSPADCAEIEGVVARQITSVLTNNGYLTEIWRPDWHLDGMPVGQVFQRVLDPGAASGRHSHRLTTDRLACALGRLLVVLYDARRDSPTHGNVADFRLGRERPAVIVVPPGVWHGVRNIGPDPTVMLNVVDLAYDYEDPDHYRLPWDTPCCRPGWMVGVRSDCLLMVWR